MRINPTIEDLTQNYFSLKWNSGRFAASAGTIFCVGRNYADHAKELGNSVPTEPMIFLKSRNSLAFDGASISIPEYSNNMHFEGELVLLIGELNNSPAIIGIGIGIDFTLRDIQDSIKINGSPWTKAKNFPSSATLSSFSDNIESLDLNNLSVRMWHNDSLVQNGNTSDMIFDCNKLVEYINSNYGLVSGDLIFTGTPAGVGKVDKGDRLKAELGNGEKIVNSVTINVN